MKIHEYQAKSILSQYGVPIPKGDVASTPQEAKEIAERIESCFEKSSSNLSISLAYDLIDSIDAWKPNDLITFCGSSLASISSWIFSRRAAAARP